MQLSTVKFAVEILETSAIEAGIACPPHLVSSVKKVILVRSDGINQHRENKQLSLIHKLLCLFMTCLSTSVFKKT